MGVSRAVVRLRVGHTADVLNFRTVEGCTHKWTVFVRSAGPHQFVDRSFIRKVVFVLHPDFNNSHRVVKQPPFEVTEHGFAGFCIPIYVYFSGFNKGLRILHNMELCLGRRSEVELVHAAEISELPNAISSIIAKYGGSIKVGEKLLNSQPGEMPLFAANTNGTDDHWRNCIMKAIENKIVEGQGEVHERIDKSISESEKELEEIFEFKRKQSLPVAALANLDGSTMMREVNRSLTMETEDSKERSKMVNVENIEIGKASAINSEFVGEVYESRNEMQKEFDIVMQECNTIEQGGAVEENMLNERHSSISDMIDEEKDNINAPKLGGESVCEVEMETAKTSEISMRENNSSCKESEAIRSLTVGLTEAKRRSSAEFGCRKRGHPKRSAVMKEMSMEMRSKVGMEQESTKTPKIEARERTKQRLEEERWEEDEMSRNKQQLFMARNAGKDAMEEMGVKKRGWFDEFDSDKQQLPVANFARSGGVSTCVDEGNKDVQKAVSFFTGGTARDWKKGEEELQNALKVGTKSEHFREDELHLKSIVPDDAKESLESEVIAMSSLTSNSGLEAVEEASLVRLNDELMRMRDPNRLGAFVDAVMACDTASLFAANMNISEDGLLSFDVRKLSHSLRSRLHEICFGCR